MADIQMLDELFAAMDANSDGAVSKHELVEFLRLHKPKHGPWASLAKLQAHFGVANLVSIDRTAFHEAFKRAHVVGLDPAMFEFAFMSSVNDRVFDPSSAKGGQTFNKAKTAICFIEYQNEFATDKGKMHNAVKEVMAETGMLKKSAAVAAAAREAGAKVFHIGIQFNPNHSDNPNGGMGILAGCKNGELFTEGTWNAEFCDTMKPQDGDITIIGKRGLDAFPNTTLDAKLKEHGIEHVVLGGFLTNCCVESTMRTAYEKGYDVITLIDCTACTSIKGQEAAAGPDGTFGMFSTQKTAEEFLAMLAA